MDPNACKKGGKNIELNTESSFKTTPKVTILLELILLLSFKT